MDYLRHGKTYANLKLHMIMLFYTTELEMILPRTYVKYPKLFRQSAAIRAKAPRPFDRDAFVTGLNSRLGGKQSDYLPCMPVS